MNRRSLLKTVGATGLLGLGVGAGAATSADEETIGEIESCHFECCERCLVAYCPGGCDCERYCDGGPVEG